MKTKIDIREVFKKAIASRGGIYGPEFEALISLAVDSLMDFRADDPEFLKIMCAKVIDRKFQHYERHFKPDYSQICYK